MQRSTVKGFGYENVGKTSVMRMDLRRIGADGIQFEQRPQPVRIVQPALAKGGLMVTCPHSGRFYPPELLSASVLDPFALRRSEDGFVDVLFQDATTHGATLLVNEFARAFVDVNRSARELDPKLINDVSLDEPESSSQRVKVGLGVIPRTVGDNVSIYAKRLSREVAVSRLMEVHDPWHTAIEVHLADLTAKNGAAIVLDCHSMPSKALDAPGCDIVLGDRFGASCSPLVTTEATAFLRAAGLKVVANNPFAGGYCTSRHGQPQHHHHVLQIEINRSLYMNEGAVRLKPSHQNLRTVMAGLVRHLVNVSQTLGDDRGARQVV